MSKPSAHSPVRGSASKGFPVAVSGGWGSCLPSQVLGGPCHRNRNHRYLSLLSALERYLLLASGIHYRIMIFDATMGGRVNRREAMPTLPFLLA